MRASRRLTVFASLVVVLVHPACITFDATHCADGSICPIDRVCVPGGGCAPADLAAACAGRADGASCTTAVGSGVCDGGVCVEALCGDGYVTGREACDDGNTIDHDGCSSDCSSSELCGNGIVDVDLGENCDCGAAELAEGCVALNSDTPGATCKSNCILQCGDGEVNAVEDCDTSPSPGGCVEFGFDRGPLTCSSSCANDVSACGEFGIQRVGGPGLPGAVRGHWIAPTGEDFLAGGSFLAAQNGSSWTIVEDGLFDAWNAVSGIDASFVIAVGQRVSIEGNASALIRRWDGAAWQTFSIPATPLAFLSPYGVVVASATDVVVVGSVQMTTPPFSLEVGVFAWDGTQWTRHVPAMAGALNAVTDVGGGDLVAVGNDGLVAWRRAGVWSTTTAPGAPDLRAVWSDAGLVIAAGNDGAILRYSIVDDTWSTDPPPATTNFIAIAGRSPTDLYASSITATGPMTFVDLLWHYDGNVWFPLEVDASVGRITTLRKDSLGDLVGQGVNFTTYRLAPGGWGLQSLSDETIFGPTPALVTGAGDTVYATSSSLLYRYRSTVTGIETIDLGAATALHALGADELYAGSLSGASGVLRRYDGQAMTNVIQRCPTTVCQAPPTITSLWAQAPGHVHFISEGSNGETFLFERTPDEVRTEHARLTPTTTSDRFIAVSGTGAIAYALTREGRVWSNETGSWAISMQLPLSGVSIWVAPTGTVFAGGDDGIIWSYVANQWVPLPTETHERINALHGSSETDVFATTQTTVQHFDGTRWSPVRANPDGVGTVWATDRDVYFVGHGSFRRLQRPLSW